MNVLDIIEIIGGFVGIIALIIVVWDHFRDDRKLANQVQDFYENIEKLIYTFYDLDYFINQKYDDETNSTPLLSENEYLTSRVKYTFDEYSKYLGLAKTTVESADGEILDCYMSKFSLLSLIEFGELKYRYSTSEENYFVADSTDIKRQELRLIITFLDTLRKYWDKNYYKRFFRPQLKSQKDFNQLRGYHGKSIMLKKLKKKK